VRRLAGCLLAAWIAFAPAGQAAEPTVILISLDGTRHADVRELPFFRRVAERGARADGLEPVFPSNTFPNHVTLVTGVAPDQHGIVSNVFFDPERGLYRYEDDPTWIEVEPLWSLLARAGIPSASFHWVGSEGNWRSGLGPRHWEKFDAGVPERRKVEQILAWLDLRDPTLRPRLITCWLRGADATGHRFGPDTEESAKALRRQERALGELLQGLESRSLLGSTTLLLVSDHGMARVDRSLDLEAQLGEAGIPADVIGGGGFATVRVKLEKKRAGESDGVVARAVELTRARGLEAWARGECPPPFACSHRRFGAFVAVAPVGTAIVDGSRALAAPSAKLGLGLRGAHGHRPEHPEMAGIFFALGREVAPGARLATVRAVDVAPTVLALLGQPVPEWMAGSPIPLRSRTEP
jgi:arylsulfatase A-like enzyme